MSESDPISPLRFLIPMNGDNNDVNSTLQRFTVTKLLFCGQCAGGNTGITPDSCGGVIDCNGVLGGTALVDSCGVCSGGNTGSMG